jgi:hypothetical protein
MRLEPFFLWPRSMLYLQARRPVHWRRQPMRLEGFFRLPRSALLFASAPRFAMAAAAHAAVALASRGRPVVVVSGLGGAALVGFSELAPRDLMEQASVPRRRCPFLADGEVRHPLGGLGPGVPYGLGVMAGCSPAPPCLMGMALRRGGWHMAGRCGCLSRMDRTCPMGGARRAACARWVVPDGRRSVQGGLRPYRAAPIVGRLAPI